MSHDWSKALGLRKSSEPEERPRIEDLPWPEQWDRHREQHPSHEATLRDDGIYCNHCLWHTYPLPKPKTPPPWKPNRKDFEEVPYVAKAQHIRSSPLQYGSLARMTSEQIDGIERTAMVGIRKAFDQQGLTLDETTLRAHWAFVVEGYGFPMPEGYIHPEAPPEEAQKAREGWARSVQGAADSVLKQIFLTVWRRKALPPPAQPKSLRSRPVLDAIDSMSSRPVEYPRCGPCNMVFPTEESLRKHVDEVHPLPESRENDFKIIGEG